ncbi:hypothetical protein [Streptomyces sp. NPDC003032]
MGHAQPGDAVDEVVGRGIGDRILGHHLEPQRAKQLRRVIASAGELRGGQRHLPREKPVGGTDDRFRVVVPPVDHQQIGAGRLEPVLPKKHTPTESVELLDGPQDFRSAYVTQRHGATI